MSRRCTVCDHEQRPAIDEALAAGRAYRYVAVSFGISVSAAVRHKRQHLAPRLARALEKADGAQAADLVRKQESRKAQDLGHALDVVRQLQAINAACLEILQKSRASGRDAVSLGAVDRIHRQIELQARLLGELEDGQIVNVLVAPEWHEVRLAVVDALGPYPEARAAVSRALDGIGGGRAG